MSFFGWRRKSLNISEEDPVYKVRYLGNIHTCMMKGDGCVDKPASILWNNYLQSSHQALEMKIVVSVSGIKAFTKEQGLMQYWSHKIAYILAHPQYPKMFLWVYRHEGRKMKLDLRCHAVLCKNETKTKLLEVQLHDKLLFALKEFVRDKRRKHNSRLIFEKTNTEPSNGSILPLRQQMLSQGGKFKPPVSKMNSAPKLGSIYELDEKEEEKRKGLDLLEEEEEEEEEEEGVQARQLLKNNNIRMNPKEDLKEVECEEEDEEEGLGGMNDSIDEEDDDVNDADDDFCTESDVSDGIDSLALDPESDNVSLSSDHVCRPDGHDEIHFLTSKQTKNDSDGESSESGFSDSSKEIGLYRVEDGNRLSEERDDIDQGPPSDKVNNCLKNDSFDGDDEMERSNSMDRDCSNNSSITSCQKSISKKDNNNNNKLNPLESSGKEYIHSGNTTTSLKETNPNNTKNISESNNDNNNNNNNNNNSSCITESSHTQSSTNSSSKLSSSSSSSSSTTASSSLYNSTSSTPTSKATTTTCSSSSSLPSTLVSSSWSEKTKMVQCL